MLAFVNKGGEAVRLTLPASFKAAENLQRWELQGPSLTAKSGVQFGPVPETKQTGAIEVAANSATILKVS
jgi:hypothetical protein